MELGNGKYRAKAKDWLLSESSGKGTPAVSITFELTNPELGGGVHLTWDGWLTDATYERTVESLRRLGWKGDDVSAIAGLDTEVELVVENEEYEGKSYPKVKFVNSIGGMAFRTPMSADKVATFTRQMRDRIRAFDASQGKAPPPRSAPRTTEARSASTGGVVSPEPPPWRDDDIPF